VSRQIYKSSVKHKIIVAAPKEGSNANENIQMTVDTAGVTKSFSGQLAEISVLLSANWWDCCFLIARMYQTDVVGRGGKGDPERSWGR
jgi:hypothetical protein